MIISTSEPTPYRTRFSDGTHEATADTTADKGGSQAGFRPHDLLEAALANCVNMSVRMYADHHDISLAGVTTRVTLDRHLEEEVVFRYEVELDGDLTPDQKRALLAAARACPVRKTLSKRIRFQPTTEDPDK